MANINDYKIIGRKSLKYFKLLSNELEFDENNLTEKQMERFGFYLFIIEHLSPIRDVLDIADIVTDTDFNKILFDIDFDDCGIDAIMIDDDENHIQMYNFKYRDKFKVGGTKLQEIIVSSKFINAIVNENLDNLENKTKEGAAEVIKRLNSNDEYKMSLYVVCNEEFKIENKDHHLKQMEDLYGLEVKSIGLTEISQFVSLRPEPLNAELIVDSDAVMSFSESSLSSSKSYILRLPLSEVIRITCSDSDLRNEYSIEDLTPLSNAKVDYSVLFDNVRGLVVKSKYNKNISETLKNDPTKFFMYNNGLTLTANNINADPVNANKKIRISLTSFQVLNGGQTLRTIHNFNSESPNHLSDYLAKSEVLVRIFRVPEESDLKNNIAEYTNSQNSISNIELKSLRKEQLQIEQYLNEHNIIYSRKTGDTGIDESKTYLHKISMERFGQIYMSFQGMPERATNQKKAIFDKYYKELFLESSFKLEEFPKLIKDYFLIKKEYEKTKDTITSSEQKIFYIIYLQTQIDKTIRELIDTLEETIDEYIPASGKNLTEARRLIQLNFKVFLDTKALPIIE